MGIKCSICGCINESFAHKCSRCGRPLSAAGSGAMPWFENREADTGSTIPVQPSEKWVLCPDCGYTAPIKKGLAPPVCPQCLLHVFTSDDIRLSPSAAPQSSVPRTDTDRLTVPARHGPMRHALKEDDSSMSLLIAGSPAHTVNPEGETLPFDTGSVQFHHEGSGWYMNTMSGTAILNGEAVVPDTSRQLFNGDLLQMWQKPVRVEISGAVEQSFNSSSDAVLTLLFSRFGELSSLRPDPSGALILQDGTLGNGLWVWHEVGGWYIRDLSGGLLINGEKLNKGIKKQLRDGDQLNIGQYFIRTDISGR